MSLILNASPSLQPLTMEGHCYKGYLLMECFPSSMGYVLPFSTAQVYVWLKAFSLHYNRV